MQLVSLNSVPVHATLSSSIGIVPWPKYAPVRAMEPEQKKHKINLIPIYNYAYRITVVN